MAALVPSEDAAVAAVSEMTDIRDFIARMRDQLPVHDTRHELDAVVVKSGADAVAALEKPGTTYLVVRDTRINPTALGDALAKNRTIQVLKFVNVELGGNGFCMLLKGLSKNISLGVLRFDNTSAGLCGARALGDFLSRNHSLREFSLVNDDLGIKGFRSIITGLDKNNSLLLLDLSHDNISLLPSTEVFTAIAYPATYDPMNIFVRNRALRVVSLRQNCFTLAERNSVTVKIERSGRHLSIIF